MSNLSDDIFINDQKNEDEDEDEDEDDVIAFAINNLELEMDRYCNNVRYIWNNHIKKFLLSTDCLTLQFLSINDYDLFLDFMTEQITYKSMIESMNRLKNRQNYLIKNNIKENNIEK